MGSLWWWVFRTCVLPGWVAGLILWRTSSLASRRLDSRNGAKVVTEVTLSKVVTIISFVNVIRRSAALLNTRPVAILPLSSYCRTV